MRSLAKPAVTVCRLSHHKDQSLLVNPRGTTTAIVVISKPNNAIRNGLDLGML